MAMWTPERELMGMLVEVVLDNKSIIVSSEKAQRIKELWQQIDETGQRRDENEKKLLERAENLRRHGLSEE